MLDLIGHANHCVIIRISKDQHNDKNKMKKIKVRSIRESSLQLLYDYISLQSWLTTRTSLHWRPKHNHNDIRKYSYKVTVNRTLCTSSVQRD